MAIEGAQGHRLLKLRPEQRQQLHHAFLRAFPTRPQLTQMVAFGLGENLAAIVAENANLEDTIFQLIAWAEDRRQLAAMMDAARIANPQNPDLLIILQLTDWAALD